MQSLEYVCAATGERIGFDGPLYGETLTGLRARVWDYSLASRGMTGITRKAREATVTVKIHDSPATLDLLRRLADADMASENPGTLVADGEWEGLHEFPCNIPFSCAADPYIAFGRFTYSIFVAP